MPGTRSTAQGSLPREEEAITMSYLDRKFAELEAKFTDLISAKDARISSLEDEVKTLQAKVSKLHENIDENEAYERRDCLVFSGAALPSFSTGEICSNLVTEMVTQKLQLNITQADISVSHRLGPKPASQATDKRPIIAKFCRRDLKREVLKVGRSTRAEGFYVSESLTPARKNIFYTLRQIRKAHPSIVKGLTTRDGRIYAYTEPVNPTATNARDQQHYIGNQATLAEFCEKFVKLPLENFLSSS